MSTSHVTDYSKLPLDIVIDLINHDHGTNLTTAQISIDAPVEVEENRTAITVRSVLGSGYRGSQVLHYNRVPLAALTALEETQTLTIADVSSYAEVIGLFNEKYGVNVTVDDVTIDGASVADAYEQPQGPVTNLVIAAKAGSYVWHGETVFKLRSSDMLLSDALPITTLDGLVGPAWLPGQEPPELEAPEGHVVHSNEIEGVNEVRVTDDGAIRVFKL